jgi:hypothetical protein
MPSFLFFSTQLMHVESKTHNSTAMFFLKPYTLAVFEPGTDVSESDAMSTAGRHPTSHYIKSVKLELINFGFYCF